MYFPGFISEPGGTSRRERGRECTSGRRQCRASPAPGKLGVTLGSYTLEGITVLNGVPLPS